MAKMLAAKIPTPKIFMAKYLEPNQGDRTSSLEFQKKRLVGGGVELSKKYIFPEMKEVFFQIEIHLVIALQNE